MTPQEMKGLWDLLAQTWGSKFYEQYGPSPNDAWTMTLANTSRDAAMYAMRKLIETGSAFAPTLPEFMVHSRKWDRDNAPRYDCNGRVITGDNVRQLIQPADPEKTRQNLERIRQMLKS
jgi:hypothetical protein